MKTVTLSFGKRKFVIEFGLIQLVTGTPELGQQPRSAAGLSVVDPDHVRHRPGVSFWGALTPAQRDAFISVARERTFAAGATLMQEGEQADHVLVIRGGWAKVCVNDNGRERVIAERGPGELVGERSSLHVSVRSASVAALETVTALVTTTAEFAGFIAAHPSVLGIVESQVYDRLTKQQAAIGSRRRHRPDGENWTVLLTDVVGFGRHERTARDRLLIRQAILGTTQAALGDLWPECEWADRGDGILVVIPPQIATRRVIELLLNQLPRELRLHNRTYANSIRIQLRAAVTIGPVIGDDMGFDGPAIILAARLLEAISLKQAINKTGANLGVIVSDFVHETAVQQANGSIDCDGFRRIRTKVKETRVTAWMRLVDTTSQAVGPIAGLFGKPQAKGSERAALHAYTSPRSGRTSASAADRAKVCQRPSVPAKIGAKCSPARQVDLLPSRRKRNPAQGAAITPLRL